MDTGPSTGPGSGKQVPGGSPRSGSQNLAVIRVRPSTDQTARGGDLLMLSVRCPVQVHCSISHSHSLEPAPLVGDAKSV
jgi:hypothetical protein